MSFRKVTVSSIKWASIAQIGKQVFAYLVTAILAHLLSPMDFGLIGMAIVVIGFIELLKDLGTSAAIIQRQNTPIEMLSSVFWVNIIFSVVIVVFLFATSPLISFFYQEPRLTRIIQVLSISFLFSGLGSLQSALLQKNMSFDLLAKIELVSYTMGSCFGIYMALRGAGVWSLVCQSLLTSMITTICLWIKSTWKPLFYISWLQLKSICSYSLNLTGFNIFNYLCRNMDYILIGRYLGAQELGYYTLAYQLMIYPIQNITSVLGRVLFPALSKIQNDNKRFKKVYALTCSFVSIIAFPMMAGIFIVADPMIIVVLGEKWQPVIVLLMILAPVGIMQSIGATVGVIYQAKGRTDWLFYWSLFAGGFVTICFLIGLKWGAVGVASAYLVAVYIMAYPSFAIPFKLIDLNILSLIKFVVKPFVGSMIMISILLPVKLILLTQISPILRLIILIPCGIFIYSVYTWRLNRKDFLEIIKVVKGGI